MIKTNEKGITMMALIIYIIIMLIVIGILATLNNSYRKGIVKMRAETTSESEYSKLNLYLLEEAKKTNNVALNTDGEITTSYEGDSIAFRSGNVYSFEDPEGDGIFSIYLEKINGEKFEIAYNVVKSNETDIFKVSLTNNGSTQVKLTLSVNESQKVSIYVLSNQRIDELENEAIYNN